MSKTIEEIKEEFAKGEGYESYLDLAFSGNYYAKHSDSEDTINELMVRYAQSQTQELKEQNAELVGLLKKCKELMENSIFTPHKNTASVITQLLTKYQHLNQKP